MQTVHQLNGREEDVDGKRLLPRPLTVLDAQRLLEDDGEPRALVSLHHGADLEAVRATTEEGGFGRIWLAGAGGEAFHRYHVASCPVFFLIGRDGKIEAACGTPEELAAALAETGADGGR